MKVSACIDILEIYKTICMVNNIKMNEKNCILTHLYTVAWSIGTNDTNGFWAYVDPNIDVLISGLTQVPNKQLECWYT